MQTATFGTWNSPLSSEKIAEKSLGLDEVLGDGDKIYSAETRPNEGGRTVLVCYNANGSKETILPEPYSVRTRVHEYGGRAFTVHEGTIYFVNYQDQNLYRFKPGSTPVQITHAGIRFAEPSMTAQGIVAVAERHFDDGREAQNFLALIDPKTGAVSELASGHDFYAAPHIIPSAQRHTVIPSESSSVGDPIDEAPIRPFGPGDDGIAPNVSSSKLAWISWRHPNMPWNSTELWVADLVAGKLINQKQIQVDNTPQAYQQPRWDKDGNLFFISDASNWWNFYRMEKTSGKITALCPMALEFASAPWILGTSSWAFWKDSILCIYTQDGFSKIALLSSNNKTPSLKKLDLPFTDFSKIYVHKDHAYFLAGSAVRSNALIRYDLHTGSYDVLAQQNSIELDPAYISRGKHISFPSTSRQKIAYAFFYPPSNPAYQAPAGTKPPLIIILHGGPTTACTSTLKLALQFWTSRGFAVADVNYGGSTGYGRKYREALERGSEDEPGYWGDVDIKDCEACVHYLVSEGLVDAAKVAIRGGSAGGYTTLAALAFSSAFKVGTSYYGICDLMALANDTHKFEARYLDRLLGALPKFKNIYADRSPINNLDRFTAPLLVLQGAEDKVVPPTQAEEIVAALRSKNVRVEYKLYAGEQHGFRKAETMIDALKRELSFYLSVFYS